MHEYCMDEKECKRTPGIKDSNALCRVTEDGFEVEGQKVSAQSEECSGLKVAEGVDSSQNQGMRHDESSSPQSPEALESWLKELLDPNFDGSLDFCCLNDLSSPTQPTKELQISGKMDALKAISLPRGFGFHPSDVDLISHYLKMKNSGQKIDYEVIPELDICKCEPWDLPGKCPLYVPAACCQILTKDSKWHFFTSRDRKYPNSTRTNRATVAGYWKSTGKDRSIRFQNRVIGTKKTLVFHKGRPPRGKRTDWIMHEYSMDEEECKRTPGIKDSYVLCRVTKRDGLEVEGEKVSAQSEEFIGLLVAEGVDSSQNQGMRHDESCSPESAEALESWLNELLDPNFDGSLDYCCLNNLHSLRQPTKELQMSDIACTTLTPTNEPLEYGIHSEEILGILGDDFNAMPEITQTLAAHPLHLETNSAVEDFIDKTPDLSQNSNFIQIRERREEPPALNFPHRIMLARTSKMKSRNISSLKETIECAQADRCIRSNSNLKLPTMLEVSDQILVKESKQKCVRIKAGMDYGLLWACMIGVACLIIIYFLLRDSFCASGFLLCVGEL